MTDKRMGGGKAAVAGAWQETFVESVGGRVQVCLAGEGSPLVILPDDIGVPGWLPLHEALAARYTLYLVSHPGFGRSDRPEWARNVQDLAALEAVVLRELGLERPAVLGFGFGGWPAAELATQCGPCFSQMVLVAPFGMQPEAGEIFDQFLGRGPRYVRAGVANPAFYESTYGSEPNLDTLEQWEINREMTARVAWAPYLLNQAFPHLLPAVSIPTLVLWGEDDVIIPATEAGRWARLIPGAQCRLLARCGHRADVEQPEELEAAVFAFLQRP